MNVYFLYGDCLCCLRSKNDYLLGDNRSSEILLCVDWQLVSDVLSQAVGPIFKAQAALRGFLVSHRRFGTTYRFYLQGPISPWTA